MNTDTLPPFIKAACDNAPIMIMAADKTTRFFYANKMVYQTLGYTIKEFSSMSIADVDIGAKSELLLASFIENLKKDSSKRTETLMKAKDGRAIPVELNVMTLTFEDREYFCAFVHDITDRKIAERNQHRLAAAVHSAAESIMITDTDGIIQYVNPYFERMTGYTKEEVTDENARIMKSGKHDDNFYKNMWAILSEGKTWHGIFINKKKDGSLFEEQAVIAPVYEDIIMYDEEKSLSPEKESRRIVGYVAVKRDITHEKTMEKEVQQSQKMAAIGQFAYKVAHEFTNSLVGILGNIQLIKQLTDPTNPNLIQPLHEIQSSGDRISSLTSQLLAFGHPSKPELTNIKLCKIISGITEMIKQITKIGIEMKILIEDRDSRLKIDLAQIEQAIIHIVLNAAESMTDSGKMNIRIYSTSLNKTQIAFLDDMGETFQSLPTFGVISISDTGCGISEEAQSHIFEPFFTTKNKNEHSGLGLTMAYAIIRRHHGILQMESDLKHGTTANILLPTFAP
ncbi:PAS domain S-box protein [Verrucomicrobiota bacterium]